MSQEALSSDQLINGMADIISRDRSREVSPIDTAEELLAYIIVHQAPGDEAMSSVEGEDRMKAGSADQPDLRSTEPLLQFFEYAHLPARLQAVSSQFHTLACKIIETLPRNPERTVALRKLLEAKDCAVRALIYK